MLHVSEGADFALQHRQVDVHSAMSLDYRFQNLCGTVYTAGNVVFTADGNKLFSPVGNRVSIFDLVQYVLSVLFPHARCSHAALHSPAPDTRAAHCLARIGKPLHALRFHAMEGPWYLWIQVRVRLVPQALVREHWTCCHALQRGGPCSSTSSDR